MLRSSNASRNVRMAPGLYTPRKSSWNCTGVAGQAEHLLASSLRNNASRTDAPLHPTSVARTDTFVQIQTDYRTTVVTSVSVQTSFLGTQRPTAKPSETYATHPSSSRPVLTHLNTTSGLSSPQGSGITAAVVFIFLILLISICLLIRRRQTVRRYPPLTVPRVPQYRQIHHSTPTAYTTLAKQEAEQPLEQVSQTPPPLSDLRNSQEAELRILSLYRASRHSAECHPVDCDDFPIDQTPRPQAWASAPASLLVPQLGSYSSHQPLMSPLEPPSMRKTRSCSQSGGNVHNASQLSILLPEPALRPTLENQVSPASQRDDCTEIPTPVIQNLEQTYSTLWSYYDDFSPSQQAHTAASSPTDSGATHLLPSAFSSSSSGGEEMRIGDCRRATMPYRSVAIDRVYRSSKAPVSHDDM